MSVMFREQETVISFGRLDEKARVYTSDRTVMTKLDKKAEDPSSPWTLVDVGKANGEVVSKTYEADKKLISFRTKFVTRNLSEEERAAMAMRLRAFQNAKKEDSDRSEDMDEAESD